jgi:hypothetical protein
VGALWTPEYADLVVAAEDYIKQANSSGLSLIDKEKHGRGLLGVLADPYQNYSKVLEQVPKIIKDEPSLQGAVMLANKLTGRERYLTKDLSTAPGMEFHHTQSNLAVADTGKYLPGSALRDLHAGMQDRKIYTGANEDSGKVITAWGHRLGANSAHRDIYTQGSNPKYWGTVPLNIPMSAFTLEGPEFVEALVDTYAKQKGQQQERMALDVYEKEAPIREFLESIAPSSSFKSNALRKQALIEAGVTSDMVTALAKKEHGSRSASENKIKGRKSSIQTENIWNISRPNAADSRSRIMRM